MAQRPNRHARRDDEDDDFRPPVAPPDPAEESYTTFMSKFGREGAKVRVYRITPQGKLYCFLEEPENVTPETIRMFHARQHAFAHEVGSYLIEVEVNGEVRPPFQMLIAPQTAAPGIPDTGGQGAGMDRVLQMMQAQNERLERLLMTQHQAPQTPMSEMADALLKIDQLRGGGKELPVDTLLKAIELGKSMGGGETDWTMKIFEVVKEAMPVVGPALASLASRIGGGARPPEAPQTEEEQVKLEEFMLQQGIAHLKKKALAGSEPGLYIDLILDNREDANYARLISKILNSDFSTFAELDPDITRPEYEPFFRELYDGIRSVFARADPVASAGGGESGNTSDASGNAKPRKGGKPK
jgi:hypothetical protein